MAGYDCWFLNCSDEVRELYQSSYPFTKESMRKSILLFEEDITAALKQFSKKEFIKNATLEEIAHVFANAMSGFKQNSDTVNELKHKIDLLIKMSIKL